MGGDASLGQRILRARLKRQTRTGRFIGEARQFVNRMAGLRGFDPDQLGFAGSGQ
jgi:hypothetical protein